MEKTGDTIGSSLRAVAAAAMLAFAAMGAACSPVGDPAVEGAGSLTIPLSQPAPDGASYHLRDATFHITGHDVDLSLTGEPDDPSVQLSLEPGAYQVALLDGWTLELVTADDPPAPLDALLASHNPMSITVQAGMPAIASFQFLLGASTTPVTITFGVQPSWMASGTLTIDTNEPQPGSTGAFADALPGSEIGLAVHYPAWSTGLIMDGMGGKGLQINLSPLVAEFFGPAVFEDDLGPALTGTSVTLVVTNHGTFPFDFDGATFASPPEPGSPISYELILTAGPSGSGGIDLNGFPMLSFLRIAPEFTLNRYEDSVLTDRLTGTLDLLFTDN
jgi:hypothetical protein